MSVTIVRGVPGSGKSTWVRNKFGANGPLVRPVNRFLNLGSRIRSVSGGGTGVVFSTDDRFINEEGKYDFDFRLLGEAHGECLRKFTLFLQTVTDEVPVIVDNTNTSVSEVAPYAALALAFGHTLSIVTLLCDPVVAAARNTHGVPEKSVLNMDRRLREEGELLPPYWPHTVIEV